MNLGQLAAAIADRFPLPKAQAKELLDFALGLVGGNLKAGRHVYFRGFGSFSKKIRPARWFKNPRTGERVRIPAKPYAAFSASPALLRELAARKAKRTARPKRRD